MFVKLRKNESTDHLIARFKKKIAFEGLLDEVRDRSVYKKPSQLRQEAVKQKWRKIRSQKYDK